MSQTSDIASFSFDVPEVTKDELLYVYFPVNLANNLHYVTNLESRQVDPGWHQIDAQTKELLLVWEENQVVRDFSLNFMMIDYYKLATLMQRQPNYGMDIDSFKQKSFSGEIQIEESNNLVLPIPYEPGWVFTVDGEEYPYKVAFGGLIQLSNLPKDSNLKIAGEFFAPGFLVGLVISSIATGCFLFLLFLDYIKKTVDIP
ncbi:hypothetical protein HMPREF3199_00005 [Enterococcus faecium]|nr:YfhO family protein [Enterococcus faecium]KXA12857.1 hypothetical protein HMPREF3199_00005 [Enterococcus faecium]